MNIRVRIRAVRIPKTPGTIRAKAIADGLLKAELLDKDTLKLMSVSDLFNAGFIYKPMIYDLVKENPGQNYRYLKRVRSATMMHTKFLNLENGTQMLRQINDQVVLVPFQYYYRYILSRQEFLHEQMQNDDEYDFYLEGLQDLSTLLEKLNAIDELEIGGVFFEVVEAKYVTQGSSRGWNILLSEMDASLFIGVEGGDDSLFRLKFNEKNRMQTVKGGSMFTEKDVATIAGNVGRSGIAAFEPYFMKL